MSWFQSLRDDFTLRPFEIQHSPSDSAAMASGSSDLVTNQEPAEVQEDCSGKKKSKFQTFKKLFARKKRKEPQSAGVEDGLKGSQSSDDVSKASENNALTRSEKDKGSGSKISLGNKALSHDSVFVSDSSEANEGLGASQDSISGKVKSLQLQLKQAIRLGSPPSLMCVKKSDDAGTMSEDDGLPCSPPDFTPLHSVKGNADRNSSNSLHGIDGDEQPSCAASSRAVSPLVVPGDFSQPASPFVCLDNSAAKHKLGLRNKACNKRKPARRLELKAEGDSAVEEELTVSMIEAEVSEEQEPQRAEDESGDQLKPTVESEEEEDDEDSEPKKDSSEFPRVDKEGEDEPEAEQDVSHAPDAFCPPESPVSSLSEEEASDDQHVHSSSSSSSSSSLDSPSVTPEPPAGPREHLTDPPGFSDSADNQYESDSSSGEDMVQESREEDGSFLEEVLSSLKASHSPDVEIRGFDLEVEKTQEKQVETDERVEIKGEEAEVEDSAGFEAAAWCPATSDQTAEENEQQEEEEENEVEEEEEEEVPLNSQQEEEVVFEEEVKSTEEETEEEEEEEEEEIVERFLQHSDEEEAEGGESEEENNVVLSETVSQEETEEGQENPEEEKTETVEEKWEDREEEEGGAKVDVVEEGEDEEELREVVHESEDEEAQRGSPLQGAAEEDDAATNTDDGVPARRDEEEEMLKEDSGPEEEEEVMLRDQESEDEEEQEVEGGALDVNQEELEQEREETSPLIYVDPVEASSKPPSLPLSESRSSSQSDEAPISSPSKTSSLNINLVSPTAEKTASPLELRPPVADPAESAETEEQPEAEKDEEEQRSEQEPSRPPPAAVQEVRSEKPTDQSKARFTVAPAWQRLQNAPASPSAGPAPQDGELEAAGSKDPELKAEPSSPTKAEPLQSPGRGRSSGSFTSKLQSSTPTEPPTAARTAESAAAAEANPNSPFGVRLRKTTALLRLGSEEANSEPQIESPTHVPSFKNESPQPINSQPISNKPALSQPINSQPISNKPALSQPINSKPALSQPVSNKPALSQPVSNKPALSQPISNKPSVSQPISNKPALPKKPEVPGDAGVKLRRISEPAPPRGASGGSDPPSWISVAKQKQKVYKETPLNEITVKKEEQEKKPTSLSNIKPVGASSKVAVEKENRRTLSVATPVPPQTPKPQAPPTPAKPTPHTDSPRMPPSSPAPASIPLKSPASTTPSVPSKPRSLTSPPFSPSAVPEKPVSRPSALSRQGGSPSTALPQDEPPWMALAKKKAKAWSEMPQIVQ